MTTKLASPPRVAFTNSDGTLTRDGLEFIKDVFQRAGGSTQLSNTELAAEIVAANDLIEALQKAQRSSFTVELATDIAALTWASDAARPDSIRTNGYRTNGIGAGVVFRLPLKGVGAYPSKAYRFMDGDGNWFAYPRFQAVTQMQCGAVGNAVLVGATKTGPHDGVGSGVTGGTPYGVDDSGVFTDLLDGYLRVIDFEPFSHIVGDVRVASFLSIRGRAAQSYTGNGQGANYDPAKAYDPEQLTPDDSWRGIPYFYVKQGAHAAFNVSNNSVADQVLLPDGTQTVDAITYGYGTDWSGFAIDAWSDTSTGTPADGWRACISGGSSHLSINNCHLIRGTYGIGGAGYETVDGVYTLTGSVFTHSLRTGDNVVIVSHWRGLTNLIDCYVDPLLANCTNANFYGTNGSNAVTVGGRNEFCQAGNNIVLSKCSKVVFGKQLIDRAWLSGAALYGCDDVVFEPGVTIARCGAGMVDSIGGQIVGATSTTVTLGSASDVDDAYTGKVLTVTNGSITQTANITDYEGDDQTATIDAWSGGVTPDATWTWSLPSSQLATTNNSNVFEQGCFGVVDYSTHKRGCADAAAGPYGTTSSGNLTPLHTHTFNQANDSCAVRGVLSNGFAYFATTVASGKVTAATSTSATFNGAASSVHGAYVDRVVIGLDPSGNPTMGLCTAYAGGTRTATVVAWSGATPDNTFTFQVPTEGQDIASVAVAGIGLSLNLGALTTDKVPGVASAESGYYNGQTIFAADPSTGVVLTATCLGYRSGVAVVAGWNGGAPGAAPAPGWKWSIPTGAPSVGQTGPIMYASGLSSTTYPTSRHIVDAVGAERFDNNSMLQEAGGDRFYSKPAMQIIAPAGTTAGSGYVVGSDMVTMRMPGPSTTFAIQPATLVVTVRDSTGVSASIGAEFQVWVREEGAGTYAFVASAAAKEIGTPGAISFNAPLSSSGTCQGGTITTVQLAATESTVDDFYPPGTLITAGAGAGAQTNVILGYCGATQTAVVKRPWAVTPTSATPYVIASPTEIYLAVTNLLVQPHPTDGTFQVATFTLTASNETPLAGGRMLRPFFKLRP